MTPDGRVLAALLAVLVASVGVTAAAVPTGQGEAVSLPADPATERTGPSLNDSTEAFLECENGTSDAVLACGYSPGPNAVRIDAQTGSGDAVTVRAAELSEGGFVAVHRVSYVDGAFTESLVGVSGYLSPGLHEGIEVDLDEDLAANATLVAVVNRDSDGDRRYDFVETGGAADRPYTNTYSERAGNVTDEAGDVIGDYAPVTVITVGTYAGADGVVQTEELQVAVSDFVTKKIDAELFQAIVRAWARGG